SLVESMTWDAVPPGRRPASWPGRGGRTSQAGRGTASRRQEKRRPEPPLKIPAGREQAVGHCAGRSRTQRRVNPPTTLSNACDVLRKSLIYGFELLHAVVEPHHARLLGATRAAIKGAIVLGAVADDPALAVRAGRRECMDGAFERVERAAAVVGLHGKGLVVVVAADVAGGHGGLLVRMSGQCPAGGRQDR